MPVKRAGNAAKKAGRRKTCLVRKSSIPLKNKTDNLEEVSPVVNIINAITLQEIPENKSQGPKYKFDDSIPERYNESYIRVLPRDPDTVFVYWELTNEMATSLKDKLGTDGAPSQRYLRLSEFPSEIMDQDQIKQEEIEIAPEVDNWYVKMPEHGKLFQVDIGYKDTEGDFILITQSEPISTPTANVTDQIDTSWNDTSTQEIIKFSSEPLNSQLGKEEPLKADFTINELEPKSHANQPETNLRIISSNYKPYFGG